MESSSDTGATCLTTAAFAAIGLLGGEAGGLMESSSSAAMNGVLGAAAADLGAEAMVVFATGGANASSSLSSSSSRKSFNVFGAVFTADEALPLSNLDRSNLSSTDVLRMEPIPVPRPAPTPVAALLAAGFAAAGFAAAGFVAAGLNAADFVAAFADVAFAAGGAERLAGPSKSKSSAEKGGGPSKLKLNSSFPPPGGRPMSKAYGSELKPMPPCMPPPTPPRAGTELYGLLPRPIPPGGA